MRAEPIHGRRTDALANHARILEAARAVLAERGLDMEVGEVAERAGVGVGTLYRHFANRDDLVRAILTQAHDDVLSRLRQAAEIADPAAALRQIPFILTDDSVASIFAVMQDPRSAKMLRDVKQEMGNSKVGEVIELIAGILERGIRAGVFRSDLDPQATAAAILGSIRTVCETLAPSRPLRQLADVLVDLHRCLVAVR